MKEDIISSSLQPFTLSKKPSRLQVFTGKGGVGKTTLSMSCASAMQEAGFNVKYLSLADHLDDKMAIGLKLSTLVLTTKNSAKIYIAKKVKSDRIAKWITDTSFFNALFNMVPSLGDMILLGHIISMLEQDPTLHIILDSPSSGHAIALFESTNLWRKIFQSGPLVNDLNKMNDFLNSQENISINIVTLPSEMSIQESIELKESLEDSLPIKSNIVLNNLLTKSPIMTHRELPDFLKNKLLIEENVLKMVNSESYYIAHQVYSDPISAISNISKFIGAQS